MAVRPEFDTFGLHLCHAAIDKLFLHLEIGNTDTEKTADPLTFFKDHDLVAGTSQLLSTCEARRSRADNGNPFIGVMCSRLGLDPTLFPTAIDDGAFDCLNRHGKIVYVQRAGPLRKAPGKSGR